MQIVQGNLIAQNRKVAIIASRFNEFIVSKLIDGAQDALVRHGIDDDDITLYWTPGAFEIAPTAAKIADLEQYDAIICLGAVIRGATPHFEYVSAEASKGIAQVAMKAKCPVLFGVLTTDTIAQAIERAGTKAGNKGYDTALSAVEMMNLFTAI